MTTVRLDPTRDRLGTLRRAVAEQMAPLRALRAELTKQWTLRLDLDRARRRVQAGWVGFDARAVVTGAGALGDAFARAIVAAECVAPTARDEQPRLPRHEEEVAGLVAAWLAGARAARDPARRLAALAAALVGESILRRASADVLDGLALAPRRGAECPCCGGPPDLAQRLGGERTLLCSRCDATWRTSHTGCVGCGAHERGLIAYVRSPRLRYRLLICHVCGRYLKECEGDLVLDPLIERTLTTELDAAAEARGLRL